MSVLHRRCAQREMGARALYAEATRVGRDHVASTVNNHLHPQPSGAELPTTNPSRHARSR